MLRMMERRKIKWIITGIFLYAAILSYGQDSLTSISGKIIDLKTKEPVGFVIVHVLFENSYTQSNYNGTFKISYKSKNPIIVIRKLGYETLTINPDSSVKGPLLITLKPQSKDLSEVVVSANKPTKRLVDNTFYVSDYQLTGDHIMLLGDLNDKPCLRLITKEGEVLQTYKLTNDLHKKLFKDCFDNIHLISDRYSTQVFVNNTTIGLLDPIRISLFDSLLKPCLLSKHEHFYFETVYNQGQTKHIFGISKVKKQKYDLGTYTNEAMLKMIDEEGNRRNDKYGGSDKNEMDDVTPDELRAMRRKEDAKIFFNTVILKDAYVPVFISDDTLYIFNHPNNLIHSYSLETHKALALKTMTYNHFRQWKPLVVFDAARNKFYTTYLKDGIIALGEINLSTGKITKRFTIKHTFPKNIKVDNGVVYYLYRLKFTEDKMALYAHQLE
jgi:hypothetical protein